MSTDGILEYQGTKRVLFRGDTSNIVFDTRTTSLGIGVTGSNNPSSNLYITGNAYVSSNLAIGGVMTMGVVNVAARHNLQAVTDMGNVTTHTVEFTNPTTSIVASGNVEVANDLTVSGNITMNGELLVSATGGSSQNLNGYMIHTFSSDGTFTVTSPGYIDLLIVGGGGGGSAGDDYHGGGGGGGAGGLLYFSDKYVGNGNYTIVVGTGGVGGNGTNSSFGVEPFCIALGGAYSAFSNYTAGVAWDGTRVGSTGGAFRTSQSRDGTWPQGHKGGDGHGDVGKYGSGSGGGGAGAPGVAGTGGQASLVGGNGGDGREFDISGTMTYYAGGGGGGAQYNPGSRSSGGQGGGGQGGGNANNSSTRNGEDGTNGKGGGGGGSSGGSGVYGGPPTGSGGDGIVIIRYHI